MIGVSHALAWRLTDLGWAWRWHADPEGQARLRSGLAIAVIAVGVALALATHLINRAALAEFAGGLRVLAGGADLSVIGPRSGFAPEVYGTLAARSEVAVCPPSAS